MVQLMQFLLAVVLVVVMMLAYRRVVRLVVDPASALWRARRRMQRSAEVKRETADLDREYASLVDEYRHIP